MGTIYGEFHEGIYVWAVCVEGRYNEYIVEDLKDAIQAMESDEDHSEWVVERRSMTRDDLDALPEFEGF